MLTLSGYMQYKSENDCGILQLCFPLEGAWVFSFPFWGQSERNTGFSLEVRTVLSLLSHYFLFLIIAFLSLNER